MRWGNEPEPSKFGNRMIPAVKQFVVFLVGWIGFQIIAAIIQIVVAVIGQIQGYNINEFLTLPSSEIIVNSAAYLILLVTLVSVINFDIPKLLTSFKKWQSFIAGLICFGAIIAFDMLWGMVLDLLPLETGNNANEAGLTSIITVYPIMSLIIFGVVGPVCEELTYRVGLFSFFQRKNKILAYIVTIIIFAFIHFDLTATKATIVNELLNLPFYMFAAFAFSYTYEKYGLAGSLTAHVINNLFSVSATIISQFI